MGNSSSSSKPSNNSKMSAESENFIKSETLKHQVVIFSKTYCGYCTAVKKIFKKPEFAGLSVAIHELDNMPNGDSVQSTLASMTGQRTVPSVWIKGNHIGGSDDTQKAFRSGSLLSMLQ